jgi:hypothetical protein
VAVTLSPYIKNEIAHSKSASVKTLQQALAGNLMLSDLVGKMTTPRQVAQAVIGSVWYSKNGGAMGSLSILNIEKTEIRELVWDPETLNRRPLSWAYGFSEMIRELTLRRGAATRRYNLRKAQMWYELTSLDVDGVDYINEPDDCSA